MGGITLDGLQQCGGNSEVKASGSETPTPVLGVCRASARLPLAAEQDPLPCIYCLAGLALGMGSEVLISGMWICIPVQGLLGQG